MARSFAQFRAQLPEFGAGACQLLAGQPLDRDQACKYPPAKPGALGLEPLEAAEGVADAAP